MLNAPPSLMQRRYILVTLLLSFLAFLSAAPTVQSQTSRPANPTGLSASVILQNSITLGWDKSSGATSYNVRNYATDSWTALGDVDTYVFDGLSSGTSYTLQVQARNTAGVSDASLLVASTLSEAPSLPADCTSINARNDYENLAGILETPRDIGSDRATIDFEFTRPTDSDKRITEQTVWLALPASSFTLEYPASTSGTTYTISNLQPNTTYRVKVHLSRLTMPNCHISNIRTFTTTPGALPNAPAAPTGLSTSGITQSSITLSWSKSTGATAYKVRKSTSDSWTTLGDVASYNFSGLSAGTSYNLQVRASNSGGDSGAASLSASTLPNAPAAPTGLSASGITQSSITLNWNKSAGATAYKVRKSTSDSWTTLGDVASYNFSGLSTGASYNLQVRASNNGGDSGPASLSASTLPNAPAAPTGLSTSSITQSSITLNWTKSAGATAYKVRKSTSDSWTTLGDVASYNFSGLSAGTSYNLQVRAINSGGDSGPASLSASTLPNAPAAPTGLSASGITQSSITLNWTKSTGATAYKVRKSTSDSWTTLGDVATHTFSGLSAGTSYNLQVKSSNSGGDSGAASLSASTLPNASGAPTGLSASGITQSSITLSWTKSTGATAYKVRKSTSDSWTTLGDVATHTFSGLSAGTSYNLQVRASNSGGDSGAASLAASTLPNASGAPTGLSASGITQSSITLSWTKSTGATAYKVRKSTSDSWTTLGDVATHTFSGLSAGTSYNLQVKSSNSGGDSGVASLSASTLPNASGAPTGLSASGITQSSITLNWTKSAGATAYNVRKSTSDSWTTLGDVASYNFSGLSAGTSYNLQVRASNNGGDSGAASLSASTLPNAPAAPTGLSTSGITQSSITLNWNKSTGATAYDVKGGGLSSWTDAGDVATYTFSGLSADTQYTLEVRAKNSGGNSGAASSTGRTSAQQANTLASPSNVMVSAISPSSVTVTWTKVGAATGYDVNGGALNSWTDAGDVATYTFSGLSADTQYTLQVRAKDSQRRSSAVSVTATTTPATLSSPSEVRARAVAHDEIEVDWKMPSGAASAEVQGGMMNDWSDVGMVESYTFDGLSEDTEYDMRVRAQNSGVVSPPATISARTLELTSAQPPDSDGGDSDSSSSSISKATSADQLKSDEPTLHCTDDELAMIYLDAQPWSLHVQCVGPAGVGNLDLIERGVVLGVDVWGWVRGNFEVCFKQAGDVVFLDAAYAPRILVNINLYRREGFSTCAQLNRAGTLVLLRSRTTPVSAAAAPIANTCKVLLTEVLNFRASPGGAILFEAPANIKLSVYAWLGDWVEVNYYGRRGWISAEFVAPDTNC